MKKSILEISVSIFVLVLAVTPNVMAQQHFDWVQTDANMSVLITGATIDDETVVVDDEIGIFTPGGLCAGGAVVPDDFPDERLGCAAFGAEQGQANGFQVEEEISFRIWDHGADFEVIADIQVGNEAEPIFEPNGFIVLSLSAESPGAHFVWDVTDTNMSILITSATIAGESLSEGDEVAAFTEEGVCGGGGVVPDDFPDQPMGIALFGSEPEQDNGFQADEEIEFRLWDHMVGAEVLARMNIIRGEANYVTNGLLIVALAGDAPPELILSDDAHDFEVVNIGESADWAFTVTNDGEHDLVVSNMESTVDYFTVDFEEETTFEPGSSAEYTVTFAPNAEGDLLGALRIFSNDPNDEIISISLIGAGYRVIPPTIVLSIEGMEYGNVPVGDERSQSMTISNEGDEPLLIPAIVIDNEGFSSDLEGEIEILSGESTEITFTFHPQESSDLAIEAIIQSNDPENPEVGFSLVGNGFVAGEDHHFGFVETETSMSVVVNEALLDGEPLAINDEVGVFTPGGLCAGSGFVTDRGLGIAAWGADQQGQVAGFQDGEVLTFVYFIHQIDQEFLAIAEVIEGNLNWERDELAIIELSGLTVPPDVFVEENEHDFGMVRVGRNSQWTFTVENRSEGDLLVSNVEIDGEYYEVDFQDMVVIEFQESHDFTVTFTPEDEGEFNTTLRIVSNDPDEHILEISILAGAEIILPPTIALSTDLIDFERISIEEVAELPLRITNEGDELLVIEAIDLARGVFAVDPDDEIEIPGGEFVDLTVSFEPEDVDDYVSEMVVRSNDQENGELVVTLWGSGFDPNQAHYVWEQTDSNLSILILAATLNGETLVENDEVGVFNEAGLCAGGGEVPANFPDEPMGIAAFGAEQEMDNGFTANEAISFQIWDFAADFEVDAEAQGVNGDVVFVANGFLVVNISAEGQQGGVRPVIGLSDENHNFDEVRPGSSRDWEFSVRNSGRATLVVTDVTTEGDRFSVEFGGDVELEFGEEYSYTVTFSPEEVGEYEGVVYVTSNDPIDEIVEISLIGFCEEAPAPPSIAVEPGALDFGRTVVGEQSTLPVEISNAGEEPLIVTGIDFAGDMFSSNFNREIEIAEGGVAEVLITFEPAEGGEQEGIATILSNDQENPEIQVALVGLGFAPGEIAHYEWDNTDANMSILVVSATLDGELLVQFDEVGVFTQGDLCAGGGPIPEAFPDEALGMSAWGTEQGEENGFEVGEDLNFRVWDHMAEVEADADLSVINGVAPVYQANGFIVVELEAHSRATPNMVIDEEPYNFGLVPVGESAEWDVVIENTGDADLIISEMRIEDAYFSVNFEQEVVIEPDAQIEFVVTFAPEEEGEFEGTLWLATNDPDYEALAIQLFGRTFEPQEQQAIIVVEPDALDFGRVLVNEDRTLPLTIFNEGNENLIVDAIVLENEFFFTDFQDGFEIEPGANAEINVTFTPEEAIGYQAELVIGSNDPNNGAFAVQLDGSGVNPGEDIHFEFDPTDANMSILVMEALLNGESLVENDEIGVFTPGGLCAGASVVEADFPDAPTGLAAWGAEQGEGNGFEAGEDLLFRVWDFAADFEVEAVFEVVNGVEPIYQANGFLVITMSAEGEPEPSPDIFLPEENHDFGVVPVGESGEWNMMIENHGDGDLIIIEMDINGRHFSIDFDEEVIIAAENGSEFTLGFTPEEDGEFNATLLITSNDPEDDIIEVGLSGRTDAPDGPPVITIEPAELNFGRVEVDGAGVQNLTITNDGEELLIIDAMDIDEGVFNVDFEPEIQIAGGESVEVSVGFEPVAREEYVSELAIHSNDPNNADVVVPLSGRGFVPGEDVFYEFAQTDINMSVLVTEAILNGESLIENDEVGLFTTNGLCAGASVVPGNFPDSPMGVAAWGAEQGEGNGFAVGEDIAIHVYDLDTGLEGEAAFDVVNGVDPVFQANGFMVVTINAELAEELEPIIEVNANEHDFGEVAINDVAEWVLAVSNVGDGVLAIEDIMIEGVFFLVDFGDGIVVEPDETAEFVIAFAPEAEGEFDARLTINSNAGQVDIALSGRTPVEMDPPAIVVDPQALDFGDVEVDNNRNLNITISNNGDEMLVVDAIDLDEGVFSVDFNDAIEIEGGGAIEVTVTFTPAAAEDYAADMTIRSNDPDNDAVVVALAGSGVEGGQQFVWEFDVTDANMSVLVMAALLNGESLVEGDRIGVFTPAGLCGGFTEVEADFPDAPTGVAAWGAEQGAENGFAAGEDLNFRVWDVEANIDVAAVAEVVNGVEPVWQANGFLVVNLNAEGENELDPPAIAVDPQALDFGEVELDNNRDLNITISNNGDEMLVVEAIDLEDGVFSVDFNDAIEIDAGSFVEVMVSFTPAAAEDYAADMTIRSNDPDNGAVVVALAGSGVEGGQQFVWEFDVTDANMSVLVMAALLNGESLVEGDRIGVFTPAGLCGGFTEVEADFPDAPTGVAAWGAEQGDNNGFAAGEDLNFRVWDVEANIDVAAVAEVVNGVEPVWQANGFLVVNLNAEGDADPEPEIGVEEDAHDFGEIAIGAVGEWAVNVVNLGDADLIINAMETDGDYFAVGFEGEEVVEPNGGADFLVTFTPEEDGEFAATLTIQSNAGSIEVALSGRTPEQQEDPPMIVLDQEAIDFGRVAVNGDRSVELMISNGGDEALVIDAIDLEDGVFTVDFNDPIQIEAGQGVGVVVTFSPDAAEEFAAEMTINSNDPNNNPVAVPLSGTGFIPGDEPHFMFDLTDVNMSMLITEALLNDETLIEGDEVGTFTNDGLCAGGTIVPAEFPGDPMGVAGWGSEQGQDNGFAVGGDLNFRFWDFEAEGEFVAEIVQVVNNIEPVFAPNGFIVLRLAAEGDVEPDPPAIAVDPQALDFGNVIIGGDWSLDVTISNVGEELLIVNAIDLEEGVFAVDFNDPIELEGGASIDVAVTFSPEADEEYAADMTINSNDPDNDAVVVALNGSGIDVGRFDWEFAVTDANMSILCPEAILNGESLVEGDVVGVFTPAGLCAGFGPVEADFPDQALGLAAWGAEQGEENGFQAGEGLGFRIWDAGAGFEIVAEFEVVNGVEPVWQANSFIVITISAEGGAEPEPDIVVEEDAHNFGEVEIGDAAEWQMNVANAGEADLIINGMAIDGDYFAVDFDEEVILAAGEASEFTVTFAPEEEGDFNATLTISSNDRDVDVALSGSVPGQIMPPMINVDPEAIDFGDVEIESNRNRVVTIANTGDEMLTVAGIDLEDGVFSVDFNDAVDIEGGGAIEVTVTFTPEAIEDYAADMTIRSNDPENDAAVVALVGSGIEAGQDFVWEFDITDANMSILVTEAILNDESLIEGDLIGVFTPAGLCAGFMEVEAGFPDEALGLAAWGAEQGQENGFQAGEDLGFRVWDIDANIDVAADFEVVNGIEPVWAANGFIVITISADGEAVPEPDMFVEDEAYDFGEIEIGAVGEWSLSIRNIGDADLIIDAMAIDGDYFAVEFDGQVVIEPDAEDNFLVTFSPEEEGEFAATLTIQSNDGDVDVALAGQTPVQQEEPPMIVLDPEVLDFGRVSTEGDRSIELMITNGGDELLVVDAIDLEDGMFTVDFNDPVQIEAGQGFGLVVTFAPEAVEDYAADMTIHSNDPENGAVVVPLMGSGFIPGDEPHFVFDITDVNMSVLITEALLGGESLVGNDEIGLFTDDGLCAGGGVVPDNFPEEPIGLAAWGTEQDRDNGFQAREDLNFRFWDFEAELEIDAEIVEVIGNGEPVFIINAFIVLRLAAEVEPEPDIFIEENSHHFGRVIVGESDEWLLNINNNGDADLTINSMEIDGQYFTVPFEDEVVLQPNADRGYMITFAPEEEGFFESTLTITSNDPDEGVIEFTLTGTTLEEDEAPTIALSDVDLNFGQVVLGLDRSLELIISNEGDEFLIIDAIDLGNDVFSTDFQNVIEVPGGESAALTVTFTPDERGLIEADMTIHSNDPNVEAAVVALTGLGFDPEEDVHFEFGITDVNMSILITAATLNDESLGENDEIGLFTNAGLCAGGDRLPPDFPDEAAGLAAWGTEQGQENGFAVGEDINFRIWDHAADYEVEVREVEIMNNVEQVFVSNGFMVAQLHAFGEPDVHVSAMDHDFNDVLINTTVEWNFTLTNIGFGGLLISAMEVEGAESFSVDFDEEVLIAMGEESEFTVIFAPEEVADFNGTITITTNVVGNEEIEINLTGSGTEDQDPEISLERDRLNFGDVAVEESRMLELMGENTGNGVLEIDQLEIDGDGFSIEVDQLQVDPHDEFIIEVTFTPEDFQVYNGSLTIHSNDPDNDEVVVTLTGVGIDGGENEAPEVQNPIDDFELAEDADVNRPIVIADLNRVFSDADGDALEFSFAVDDNEYFEFLEMDVNNNNELTIDPVEHFFTLNPFEVTVTANDGQEEEEFVMQFGRNAGRGIDIRSRSIRSIFDSPSDPNRDDTVDDMFILDITAQPDDPFWVDYPEDGLFVNAGDDLPETFLEAFDPDQLFGGEDQLTIRWGDDDGLVEKGAELIDNRDNTADLMWETTPEDAGLYHPTFIVEDETGRIEETGEVDIRVFSPSPIIHEPSEEPEPDQPYGLFEGEEFVLQFIADDMDTDSEELRWILDPDRNDLPDGWEFDDHMDGEAEFIWTPDYDEAGLYFAFFVVSDPEGNTDEIRVEFIVQHVPRQLLVIDPDEQMEFGPERWAVQIDEGDTLVFQIGLFNPDGNDVFWNVAQQNAMIANFPGNPGFDRDNPNAPIFTWVPPYDAAREEPYVIMFDVSGEMGEDFADQLEVHIFVLDHNPEPRIVNPIEDIGEGVIDEDAEAVQIADLDDVFVDPEEPNNPIDVYTIVIDGPQDVIFMSIDDEHVLWLDSLQENYNNSAGVDITIIAEENGEEGLEASDQFILRVTPVNDAPGEFTLLAPANGSAVDRGNYDIQFEWEAAENVDLENGDQIWYDLYFNAVYEDLDVTIIEQVIWRENHEIINLRGLLVENGIYIHQGDVRVDVTWWVVAHDTDIALDSTISTDRWTIDLQIPLTVPDPEDIMPTEFSLNPVYPNPFNPSAKVSFDLPRVADVKLTVWDLAGRRIANLVDGSMPAGRHKLEWNANGSPAGLYIFMLETGEHRFMTKGALIR